MITNDALNWLDSIQKNKPFALFLHHKAPHRNFVPALKYLEIYKGKKFPEPATLYNKMEGHGTAWQQQTMGILNVMRLSADLKVDPEYLKDIPGLVPDKEDIATYNAIIKRLPKEQQERYKEIYAERGKIIRDKKPTGDLLLQYKYQWYMQDYIACVASIDESIGRVLDYLDQNKLANNTLVIYTSDQNFYLGENGWFDKRFAYDVSMSTPLLVRWPAAIKAGIECNEMVQNIDYAPTLLDISGADIPAEMQGTSLKGILTSTQKKLSRRYLYYHYYEYGKDHTVIPHVAIRSDRYKLIYFYTVNEWELYDLEKDPGEQHNIYNDPSQLRNIITLKNELNNLRNLYDDHDPAGILH